MFKPTIVYVDGFNLYYGLLRNTPWRWLDLGAFADRLAGRQREVRQIRYFTARIKPNPNDPHGMASQRPISRRSQEKSPVSPLRKASIFFPPKQCPTRTLLLLSFKSSKRKKKGLMSISRVACLRMLTNTKPKHLSSSAETPISQPRSNA